jgi:uncharacterized membrane protein YcaP (DUF421 family)
MSILPSSWLELFTLETPLIELCARGAVLYGVILVLLRVMPRRTGGELATMDLILLLLITEAASHSLGDFTSLADGAVLITFIMVLNYVLNALSYRFKWIERLVSTRPIQIVRDGHLLRRNMRKEFLTEEELLTYLRKNGVDDLSQVKSAFIEGEGQITMVKQEN